MNKNISHPFVFTQSYRRLNELAAPNEFPIYSEAFSIGKINIESVEEIVLRNVLIQAYFFRSKQALENPVTLALLMGDNLEGKLITDFPKILDPGTGVFSSLLASDVIEVIPQDMIQSLPIRAGYQGLFEFGSDGDDYLTVTDSNYPKASANVILKDERVAQYYLIQGSTFIAPGEVLLRNSNQSKFLYIIPFVPKIQQTLLASSGRINFEIEY